MPKDPTEVGAIWKRTNERGEYFSMSLDVNALLALNGGDTGKNNLTAFPIDGEKTNPNAPDYRIRYYQKGEAARRYAQSGGEAARPTTPLPATKPLLDDDIPF